MKISVRKPPGQVLKLLLMKAFAPKAADRERRDR
jgi:hypothetical protein